MLQGVNKDLTTHQAVRNNKKNEALKKSPR
jgi:hypothetical protein